VVFLEYPPSFFSLFFSTGCVPFLAAGESPLLTPLQPYSALLISPPSPPSPLFPSLPHFFHLLSLPPFPPSPNFSFFFYLRPFSPPFSSLYPCLPSGFLPPSPRPPISPTLSLPFPNFIRLSPPHIPPLPPTLPPSLSLPPPPSPLPPCILSPPLSPPLFCFSPLSSFLPPYPYLAPSLPLRVLSFHHPHSPHFTSPHPPLPYPPTPYPFHHSPPSKSHPSPTPLPPMGLGQTTRLPLLYPTVFVSPFPDWLQDDLIVAPPLSVRIENICTFEPRFRAPQPFFFFFSDLSPRFMDHWSPKEPGGRISFARCREGRSLEFRPPSLDQRSNGLFSCGPFPFRFSCLGGFFCWYEIAEILRGGPTFFFVDSMSAFF